MANEIDAHVGMRLRQRRWMLGLTQQQLGDRVGIKFQQIQKYETGQNRISASRLWALATVCEAPVGYFFEGLAGGAPSDESAQGDPISDREAAELLRAYYAAPPARRRAAFDLMRVLADDAAHLEAEAARASRAATEGGEARETIRGDREAADPRIGASDRHEADRHTADLGEADLGEAGLAKSTARTGPSTPVGGRNGRVA